jgi:hypothetical protein
MASRSTPVPEPGPVPGAKPERELLQRLLGLYEEEKQIYRQVLDLSREQGEIVRRGGSLREVRAVLEQKKRCLEIIARLELMERRNKQEWERRRSEFSRANRLRLQTALDQVSALIEEILICEERNDMDLIEQASVI